MTNKRRVNKYLLALLVVVTAVLSKAPPSDEQVRGEALNAYLETVPKPVVISDRGRRSVVFMNSVYHPETWVEYAREKKLPIDLMVEVFDLPEGAPLPSGITSAVVVSEGTLFQNGLMREETSMVVTPIALSSNRHQAFFGSIYTSEEGLISVVLVLMERSDKEWKVKKLVKVH